MNQEIRIDEPGDLSGHVVAMNQLLAALNKQTRETFKPNGQAIVVLASQMQFHAAMIENIAKRLPT